ncbi:MAG TPA: cyclase family protein [Puia sp.]|jgi:arylformamidase|nr:cyclase family protein [Puia sp.]
MSATHLIDLSHTIENGLITYKGLPAPVICDYLSREDSKKIYAEGTSFQIGKIEMVGNTGTYIDCPFHRYEQGSDLNDTPLECFAELNGLIIRKPYQETTTIDAGLFSDLEIEGKAVLIHTGWDMHWNTEKYYINHPFLTENAARFLKDKKVRLVGIDSHNIDDTTTNTRPVHTILLGSGVLIVEHLCNLSAIRDENFIFSAIPPKFKGVGTFPVRAIARLHRNPQ